MATSLDDLCARATAGDEAARREICDRLYPEVQRRVHAALSREFRPKHAWIPSLFSTGDIVQDVFLGVLRGLGDFRGEGEDELRAWVVSQVKNRIIDRLRFHGAARRDVGRQSKPVDEEGRTRLPAAPDPTPVASALLEERARLLGTALEGLSERERELWRLRFTQESSFAEVAESMGYSSSESARSAFRDLRAKLLVRLRRLGISEVSRGEVR